MDFECFNFLPWQQVAAVTAQQLLKMSELSQLEVLTNQIRHSVAISRNNLKQQDDWGHGEK